jgi:DnaJ-domain-containing protein 1
MSLTVVVQETALRALARIRAEDQEAFASIKRALAALAEQPHPDQAVA